MFCRLHRGSSLLALWVVLSATAWAPPARAGLDITGSTIIQPEFRFREGETTFRWRRVRGILNGGWGPSWRFKLQVDVANDALTFLDAYAEYQPTGDTWDNLTLRGGLFYPNWAIETYVLPTTVNYSFIVADTQILRRNVGAQARYQFGSRFEAFAGVFNGVQGLDDPDDSLNAFGAVAARLPWGRAEAWYLLGEDAPNDTTPAAATNLLGLELSGVRWGNLRGEGTVIHGRRFGRDVVGGYLLGGIVLGPSDTLYGKYDWADLDRDTSAGWRQRYVVSYHHRFTPWFNSKFDVEFDPHSDFVTGYWQGDFRF